MCYFDGLVGVIGGHMQLQTAVPSQLLLLPVEPHEAKGEILWDLPPIISIKESLDKTENSSEIFVFNFSKFFIIQKHQVYTLLIIYMDLMQYSFEKHINPV